MSAIPQSPNYNAFGWTMAAYHASAARSGLVQINALQDQSLNILNNDFQVPGAFSYLAAAYANGASMKNARLVSPSLRKYGNFSIVPWDAAAVPASPSAFEFAGFYNPLPITTGDLLEADADASAATEYDTVLVFLASGPRMPCRGEIFPVKFTSATTLTAHAWSLCALTPETTLEEGMYAIVGMYPECAHAIAARLVFPGVANACRPGALGYASGAAIQPWIFRYGRLGVWGVFDAAVQPQVEFLSTTADTAEAIWLDLIKLKIGAQSQGAAYPGYPITTAMGVSQAPSYLYSG